LRKVLKKILHPVLKPLAAWHFRKPREYRYEDLVLTVLPTVFHPGIYLSTSILVEFILRQDLNQKSFLELGAGSGLVSFVAAKNGALVTATDINPEAIKGLKANAEKNQLNVSAVHSNLFENVNPNDFDVIVINPPYYPRAPNSNSELAFYCGDEFEYFHALFGQLEKMLNKASTEIYMILSEDCELKQIREIASANQFDLEIVHEEKKMQERNYIFKFVRNE
jgi:release factor glutamine methyltransferase